MREPAASPGPGPHPAGLGGHATGLTAAEAAARLARDGPNEITRGEGRSPLRVLLSQFNSPLIWLLFAASAISGVLGEVADTIAIGTILVLNAVIGFLQEYRAERAILALRSITAPRARVVRDGHSAILPAQQVVEGDLLILEAGDVVAADARLVRSHLLTTNEAPLTGESAPVEKGLAPAAGDAALADRTDTVFLGTAIATGSASAVVLNTGMRTELGKIAHLLSSVEDPQTPLQKRLTHLSRLLLVLALGVVAAVAALGLWHGNPPLEVLLSSISLAVAAVPEGLPAMVTIALAIGVQRMARRKALVRRLQAVETLGTTTVICTDKTGTLTTGVMEVRALWGPDPRRLLTVGAGCCDAELDANDRGVGDPTEVAILRAAAAQGIFRGELEAQAPRVEELPFDSTRKRMSIWRADGQLYVKGAVDLLVPLCRGGTQGALEENSRMAARALRVLGVAVGRTPREEDLELLGLIGIADPPRPEAIEAVAAARRAGVQTVMITGDHPTTAAAIAREMGILQPGEPVEERVHARVTAEEKVGIVRRWKERGQVVAMTGDGVNDAPALREAHIGIAMGQTGSEVSREASDLVLGDDNFATIVAAIREGRGIYDNIQKSLLYLLHGNAGELILMFAASVAGLPLPLLPLHILWVNLVTDGLPALALVLDPPAKDLLDRPPRRPDAPFLSRGEWLRILLIGLLEAGVILAAYVEALPHGEAAARSVAFTTLVFAELLRAFAMRSPTKVFFEVGVFSNLLLLGVVGISLALQLALHTFPVTRELFQLGPLDARLFFEAFLLGLIPVSALEVSKLVRRLLRRRP